jgi:beta-hydroxylase
MRYHLCLQSAGDGCFIKVDGEKYSWKDGEDVLFDDTFVHEVKNDADKTRIVLFCDVQRELDSDWANTAIDFSSHIAKVTTRNNK